MCERRVQNIFSPSLFLCLKVQTELHLTISPRNGIQNARSLPFVQHSPPRNTTYTPTIILMKYRQRKKSVMSEKPNKHQTNKLTLSTKLKPVKLTCKEKQPLHNKHKHVQEISPSKRIDGFGLVKEPLKRHDYHRTKLS